jgi:hypothetical protein
VVLAELREVDVLGEGTFGPKIVSRIALAADRLDWAALFFERQVAKVRAARDGVSTWGDLKGRDAGA